MSFKSVIIIQIGVELQERIQKGGLPEPPAEEALETEEFTYPKELNIVVQREFVGMRSKLDRIDLGIGFVFNPHIDNILCKDVAFQ